MSVQIFDERRCELGEGPLWHPLRKQLFWFNITKSRLYSQQDGQPLDWDMSEMTSGAGWVDHDTLLLVGETGFYQFDITTGTKTRLADLEKDQTGTRSNDGRADPFGGYWISTMGKSTEARAGTIYRYYKGEVRPLIPGITIPNAISFSPDGTLAYFADTATSKVMRQKLGARDGWPVGDPELFLDLGKERLSPDGAVVDTRGHFWNAQWGAFRIAEYDPAGNYVSSVALPAANTSCPAFGGADLTDLFCTSAMQGLSAEQRQKNPAHGQTFVVKTDVKGQAEHQVLL
ncbi:MAG: SMP-30/gluconolactonase/LRE family protein [Deltaproteobacteria bacterium]